MKKNESLQKALDALGPIPPDCCGCQTEWQIAITAIKAALANEALERKAENASELGLDYEPYGFEASIYSNARMKVDVVTGNVSIGTVIKPCGLECDCTDVCKQDDYKALWQQMCERCDELDKKLAQPEQEPVAWKATWGGETKVFIYAKPDEHDFDNVTPLYTTPPQRTWVGLTDKEIEAIWKIAMFADYGIGAELSNQPFVHYARAIEAKLKEKNQ
jgi:hypothetical protein